MKRKPHPQGLVRYTRYLDIKFKNGKHLKRDRKIVHFPEGVELPQISEYMINLIRCCFTGGQGAVFKWVYKKHS
jgi:hypothetical protein